MKEPSLDGVIETLKSEDPVAIISNPNNSDKIEELLYYLRDNNVSGLIQHITEFLKKNTSDVASVLNGIVVLYPLTLKLLANTQDLNDIVQEDSSAIGKSEALDELIMLVVRLKIKLSGTGLNSIQKQIKNLEEESNKNKSEIRKLSDDNKKLEEKRKEAFENGKEMSKLKQEKERLQQELDSFSETTLQSQISEIKSEINKKQKEQEHKKKELSSLKEELESSKEIDFSNLFGVIQNILKEYDSKGMSKNK